MPDYGKLAAEYKEKQESEARRVAAEQNREQKMLELFKTIEIQLGNELRKAEDAFGSYGFSGFSGPVVSLPDRTLSVRFDAVECKLEMDLGNSEIRIHLRAENRATLHYALEYDRGKIAIFRKAPGGSADRSAPAPSSEIAEKMVIGLVHGNFD